MFERETWGRALTLHLQDRVIVHEAKTMLFHSFESVMYVRETKFGFVPQHFDKIVEWADDAKDRMEQTEGLHSIALFKISKDQGKILAMYETKEHMDKGKGLFFMALTGVLPWITLSPDVEEYEVNWMWERNQEQGKSHG